MHKPIKYAEKGLTLAADAGFRVFDFLNRFNQRPSFTPAWADKPLLKSHEKVKPPLGWPRETDSLCPKCVREARQEILDGKKDYKILLNEKVGEIKATIIERDGKIMMVKDCPIHGRFEDVMAIDTEFFKHLEESFPGSDMRAHNDEELHNHGSSTIKYGRGSVLTIDLTNRCNMMCDPCFMDANQVGFVHELGWDDIKTLLDNAISIKPKRQMSVQFSGGEPTISPYFLDAVRYARKVGYNSVQAATNGIEFAKSADFAQAAADAGLRYAYLQFDGIGNAANSHRLVGNLFDVKLRAIENLHNAGVDIVPVITILNGINNEQVGRVVQFALDNPKKINFLSFQPVSFTGRDEEITDERRHAQRYTLSHLAHDVKDQTGIGEPVRDWFPISFMGTFTDSADYVHGPQADWGQLNCGCHPNCGVGMAVMIDKETKESVPVTAFLKAERLAKDLGRVNDGGRGRRTSVLGMALALMRNYDPFKAPTHFKLWDLLQKFDKTFGASKKDYGKVTGDRTRGRHRQAAGRPLELPVHRRHVVPGPLQLRLPAHRAVHHPLRHPGGGDLVLRLQHRGRLAEHHREDAHDGHPHQVVRRARPSRDLRRRQERRHVELGAPPGARPRGGGGRPADRPRRAGHRQERPPGEARGPRADEAGGREPAHGRALPPAHPEGGGARGGPHPDSGPRRCQGEGGGARDGRRRLERAVVAMAVGLDEHRRAAGQTPCGPFCCAQEGETRGRRMSRPGAWAPVNRRDAPGARPDRRRPNRRATPSLPDERR